MRAISERQTSRAGTASQLRTRGVVIDVGDFESLKEAVGGESANRFENWPIPALQLRVEHEVHDAHMHIGLGWSVHRTVPHHTAPRA